MLTLITGTPGAGKSLHAVWEFARKVPGSTVEGPDGKPVQRRLLSNINDLLVEHEHITPADLDTWHEWSRPGDVILFDEVQHVWRPRGLGTKVPDCIAALETHRHKGVDIILVTQHPMLVDPNIRRLVNQHLHLRRLAKKVAMVYEWDHCSNPGMVKTALQSRVWWHPKEAYTLYKSAQLHTKPTARIPRVALLGLFAVAGLAYAAPTVYTRFQERFTTTATPTPSSPAGKAPAPVSKPVAAAEGERLAAAPAAPPVPVVPHVEPVQPMGCIAMGPRCECFNESGRRLQVEMSVCTEGTHRVGFVVPAGGYGGPPHVGSLIGQVPSHVPPLPSPSVSSSRPAAGSPTAASGG